MNQILEYFREGELITIIFGIVFGILAVVWLDDINFNVTPVKVYASEKTVERNEVINSTTTAKPVNDISVTQGNAVITSVNNLVTDDVVKESSKAQTLQVGLQVETRAVEPKAKQVEKAIDVGVPIDGQDTAVPNDVAGCRSYNITYMDYKMTTNKTSRQYALLNSPDAHTDVKTGIRMIGDRYCIALGSYYTHNVGQKVNLIFEDGTVVYCILGECKSDAHTDETNRFHAVDGSVAEFVVDSEYFESTAQWSGLCRGRISQVVLVE